MSEYPTLVMILPYVLPPAITALLGYILGKRRKKYKLKIEAEELFHDRSHWFLKHWNALRNEIESKRIKAPEINTFNWVCK
jgi:hypothetical protein